MRSRLFLVLIVVAAHAVGQSVKKSTPAASLFSVNRTPVTTEEFIRLYRKNTGKPEDFTEQKISHYLDLLINFKLKVTEAKARGLDTTAAFHKEFKSYRQELKKPYLAQKDELDRLTKEVYQRLAKK